MLHRRRFALLPLQTPWIRERLGEDGSPTEMRLLTPEGAVYGGADALIRIAQAIWWAKPLSWISRSPGAKLALRRGYQRVAARRYCLGGACQVEAAGSHSRSSPGRWLPAVALPGLAAVLGRDLPGWVLMWVMALALFCAAKWITICPLLSSQSGIAPRRLIAYALGWPGMDALTFCRSNSQGKPLFREWAAAAGKTLLGVALILFALPLTKSRHALVIGWVGMIGFVFLLHFGAFHLLSLLWRTLGVEATPIMHSPVSARSLGKFWGGDWNSAFSDLMHGHFLKPLTKQFGPRPALLTIFLLSGLLHELVISFPARGGYGLPTAYFALQGLGLLFERGQVGRRMGLGSGLIGWCFVALISGVPALWLFHPPFIRNVILPMLRAIGAA